jgi:CubicO group peptidase (beta-lactamase class C family)
MLSSGIVGSDTILPPGWVREATTPKVLRGGTRLDYGYLWWTPTTEASRRDSAFMGVGIHGQGLYVNPAARVVIVLWGARPHPTAGEVIDPWVFCEAVTRVIRSAQRPAGE